MRVLAITQARTGSTRLPGKVLKRVGGKSLLAIHLERIRQSAEIEKVLVATTIEKEDDAILEQCLALDVPVFRGSERNVLDRFYQAAKQYTPEWVVRLTSDCPLIDPALIDKVIASAVKADVDYCSNTLETTFPDGMDIEIFKFSALERAWKEAVLESDKEHVTPFIYRNSTFFQKDLFTALNYSEGLAYGDVRLTVDQEQDLEVIRLLIEKLGTGKDWKSYADIYRTDAGIHKLNSYIQRNEGYKI